MAESTYRSDIENVTFIKMPDRIEDAPAIFQEMLTEKEQNIYLKLTPT